MILFNTCPERNKNELIKKKCVKFTGFTGSTAGPGRVSKHTVNTLKLYAMELRKLVCEHINCEMTLMLTRKHSKVEMIVRLTHVNMCEHIYCTCFFFNI